MKDFWNKIKELFTQADKLQHMLVGIVSTQVFFIILSFFLPFYGSIFLAALASLIIMGAKEIIWDKWFKKGTCNLYDFIAGTIGTVIELILSLIYLIILI